VYESSGAKQEPENGYVRLLHDCLVWKRASPPQDYPE
jgi:hypothetical protein